MNIDCSMWPTIEIWASLVKDVVDQDVQWSENKLAVVDGINYHQGHLPINSHQ